MVRISANGKTIRDGFYIPVVVGIGFATMIATAEACCVAWSAKPGGIVTMMAP